MARRDYEGEGITVHWDSTRCVHTARCLRALPEVFDTERRPWVRVDAADAEAVVAAIEGCPSGALGYTRADGSTEPTPAAVVVYPVRNGPLSLRGDLQLVDAEGRTVVCGPRATLCRCGRSQNQPFCDTSHRDNPWESRPPLEVPPPPESTGGDPASPEEICPPQDGFE